MAKITECTGSRKDRQKLFSSAGTIAVNQTREMGGSITCVEGLNIVKKHSDGTIEQLGTVAPDYKPTTRSLKLKVQ